MAYALPSATATVGHTGQGLLARLREALQRRQIFTRTMRELNGLTTRELSDLGLTRSMISWVALEAAYGKTPK